MNIIFIEDTFTIWMPCTVQSVIASCSCDRPHWVFCYKGLLPGFSFHKGESGRTWEVLTWLQGHCVDSPIGRQWSRSSCGLFTIECANFALYNSGMLSSWSLSSCEPEKHGLFSLWRGCHPVPVVYNLWVMTALANFYLQKYLYCNS